jgi:hypothetical protein
MDNNKELDKQIYNTSIIQNILESINRIEERLDKLEASK